MKVVIPGTKAQLTNFFFDEITAYSNFDFHYENWRSIKLQPGDVLLFQWPESIFDWNEPSEAELDQLTRRIQDWKKRNSIIYTVHNERKHSGITSNFEKLYRLVESSADAMVHFGQFSRKEFNIKYPEAAHFHIPHPLYEKTFQKSERAEARKKLNIPEERTVLIAPGLIRSMAERKLILHAFDYFPAKRKSLIVPRMLWKRSRMEFKGRIWLKKYVDVKYWWEKTMNFFYPPKYYFSYQFNDKEKLSLLMSAADAVLIPRVKILNSGNLYLALTYKLPFGGPNQGNLKEILEEFEMPMFDPEKKGDLKKSMELLSRKVTEFYRYKSFDIKKFSPKKIAKEWDALIQQLERP